MAYFDSIITNYGAEVLTAMLASGGELVLTKAAAGTGRPLGDPAGVTALVNPAEIRVSMGEKTIVPGTPTVMKVPIQLTNEGLKAAVHYREIALYGERDGAEYLFAYSWLAGEDGDNLLEASRSDDFPDTIHTTDIGLIVTNQEAAVVTVDLGGGGYVSETRLINYAAPKEHAHTAAEVTETTGETVEAAQRRQDYDIHAMREQLDTGFIGTTLTHTVAAGELEEWMGLDGTGYPEGIYDQANARLYA